MNRPQSNSTLASVCDRGRKELEARIGKVMQRIDDDEFVDANYGEVMGVGIVLFHLLEEEKASPSGTLSAEDKRRYEAIWEKIETRLAKQDAKDWGKGGALTARQMETYGKVKGTFPGLDKLKLEFPE